MRGSKPDTNGSQKLLSKEVGLLFSSTFFLPPTLFFMLQFLFLICFCQDEDMKWVEENIPTSVADV